MSNLILWSSHNFKPKIWPRALQGKKTADQYLSWTLENNILTDLFREANKAVLSVQSRTLSQTHMVSETFETQSLY